VTVAELAKQWKCSRRTAWRYIAEQKKRLQNMAALLDAHRPGWRERQTALVASLKTQAEVLEDTEKTTEPPSPA